MRAAKVEKISNISFYILIISLCWPIKYTTISIVIFLLFSIVRYQFKPFLGVKSEPAILSLGSYLLLILVYFFFEDDKDYGVKFLERYAIILVIPFIYHHSKNNSTSNFRKAIILYLISVSVAVSWSMYKSVQELAEFQLYSLSVVMTEQTVIDSNYFAFFVTISIAILSHDIFRSRQFSGKVFLLCAITLFFLGYLTLLAARVALFGAFFIVTLRAILFFKARGKVASMIITGLLTSIILVAVVYFSPYLKQRVITFYTHGLESDFRYYEFKAAFNAIQASPVVGYGISKPDEVLMVQYKNMGFVEGIKFGFNSHNQMLQSMLHFGVFGILLMLLIYINLVRASISSRDFLFMSFAFMFILFSFTEAVFERSKGILLISFFTGFLLAQRRQNLYGT